MEGEIEPTTRKTRIDWPLIAALWLPSICVLGIGVISIDPLLVNSRAAVEGFLPAALRPSWGVVVIGWILLTLVCSAYLAHRTFKQQNLGRTIHILQIILAIPLFSVGHIVAALIIGPPGCALVEKLTSH